MQNPKVYRAATLVPFGDTELGRSLGPNGSSPLTTAILDGTFEHDDFDVNAIRKIWRFPSLK
jgi:hypothetical protein